MKSIRLENVTKTFNGEVVLNNFSLIIPSGKFFALLGPSGCGKTTILRLIAGFDKPESGRVYLGSEDITNTPINKRKINTVFQNYALFPHLNVFENVSYSLRIRGIKKEVIDEKVISILKIVHLDAHAYKSINKLSGGQQQRVALARAVINEPEVLLLDEPLAALDFNLRKKMLLDLRELQEKLKTTFVYVTHDQNEALTVADQMAIMNYDGFIEQIGSPKQVYEFPSSFFAAKFVGFSNLLEGVFTQKEGVSSAKINGLGLLKVFVPAKKDWIKEGEKFFISLRPEKIKISKKGLPGFSNNLYGTVESVVYQGSFTQFRIRLKNGFKMLVFQQNEEHFPQEVIEKGNEVCLCWQKENMVLLKK